MALYARELRYVAYDMDQYLYFLSLVRLSNRKGGTHNKFVLIREVMSESFHPASEIVRIRAKNEEMVKKAIQTFWPQEGDKSTSPWDIEKNMSEFFCEWEETPLKLRMLMDIVWSRAVHGWIKLSKLREWRRRRLKSIAGDAEKSCVSPRLLSDMERLKFKKIALLKKQRAACWLRRCELKIYHNGEKRYMVSPVNLNEYENLGKRMEMLSAEILKIATIERVIRAKPEKPAWSLTGSSPGRVLVLVP